MKRTLLVVLILTGWTTANALICYHSIQPVCPNTVCTGYDRDGNPISCNASGTQSWRDVGANSGTSGQRSFSATGTTVTCSYVCIAEVNGQRYELRCLGGTYYEFVPSGANCGSRT